jgi:hypothetical protein
MPATELHTADQVVTSEKPVISSDSGVMETAILDELLLQVGTLSSVYHKSPAAFISEFEYTASEPGALFTNFYDSDKTTHIV